MTARTLPCGLTRSDLLSLLLVAGVVLSGPLALVTGAAGAAAGTPHGPPASWETGTADGSTNVGSFPSVALDDEGEPHVAYRDTKNDDLRYATASGGSWQHRTVDAPGQVGFTPSLALDDDGHPHIAYYDNSNGDLKYAEYDGNAWQVTTVASSGDVGAYASLALDDDGNPHVTYYDFSNGNLEYATHNGVSWITSTVDASGTVGAYTSLALDDDDDPRVAYYDISNSDLKYAEHSSSGWSTTPVDTSGSVGRRPSIAVDAAGVAHISYSDASNSNLKYATWDGSAHVETVDASGSVGRYSSLGLDADGDPRIAYFDASNGDLKFVRAAGGGWAGGTVVSQGQPGEGAALALDRHDNPMVVHRDGSNGDLERSQRLTAPTAPKSLSAAAGDARVDLNWTAPEYDGRATVVQYHVYRDDGSGLTKVASISGTSYTDGGTNGKQYEYVVRAENKVGESPDSTRVSATPRTVPDAPQGLRAAGGDGQVELSWSAPSDDGGTSITNYTVYRDDGDGMDRVATVTDTGYTDADVSNGEQYRYEVTATNAEGESPASGAVPATPKGPPAAPESFTAEADDDRVVLEWEAPENDGGSAIVDYRVYRGTDPDELDRVGTVAAGTTTYEDADISSGTEYVYEVRAVNGHGESPASDSVSAGVEATVTPEPATRTPTENSPSTEIATEGGTAEPTRTDGGSAPPRSPGLLAVVVVLLVTVVGVAGVGMHQLQG